MSSLRTIQSALNPGFGVTQQDSLRDAFPTEIQSYLSANSAAVNNSVVFVDSGLFVELSSAVCPSPSGSLWVFDGTIVITSSAAAGAQLQFVASDGLQVLASAITVNVYSTAAGVTGTTTVGGAAVTSGAINVVGADFFGTCNIAGDGRLKLQFSQAVATGVNTTVNAGSYMEAATILP